MNKVRIGIVGIGNMGTDHARRILAGQIPRLELTAICDVNPAKFVPFPKVQQFTDSDALLRSGTVDAVLVATPHYAHTTIGATALRAGLHVLVEKPISVHKADCQRLITAHKNKRQIFSAMFNQRTDHYYQKIRALIRSGELGEIRRVNWIITNWFRAEAYYASGGWRATWAGEGGGVLLNQCPHNLDLFWWLFGMPKRVRAYCQFGRYHKIEVEDNVTAYCEFPNGATGIFITSTGEAPGTNRLEITAERGRVVYQDDRIEFRRNEIPMTEFSRTTTGAFSTPETWEVTVPARNHGGQHNEILLNFTNAILDGTPLLAPAPEGINSVELANAMLLSTWLDETITLPLSPVVYERELKKRIANSRIKKKAEPKSTAVNLSGSFGK